jgi:hypothetical protein
MRSKQRFMRHVTENPRREHLRTIALYDCIARARVERLVRPNNWNRWNSRIRSATINGPFVSGATGTMETNRGSKHAVPFTDIESMRRR